MDKNIKDMTITEAWEAVKRLQAVADEKPVWMYAQAYIYAEYVRFAIMWAGDTVHAETEADALQAIDSITPEMMEAQKMENLRKHQDYLERNAK